MEFRQDSTCSTSTQIVEVVGGSKVQGRSPPRHKFKDNLSCIKSGLGKGGGGIDSFHSTSRLQVFSQVIGLLFATFLSTVKSPVLAQIAWNQLPHPADPIASEQ